MVKIPNNPKDLYTRYVETCAMSSVLEKEKKDLKAAILKHLGGEKAAVECGFAVKLTPGVRKTANAALIESALGVKLTEACYNVTKYDSLSVTPIKTA